MASSNTRMGPWATRVWLPCFADHCSGCPALKMWCMSHPASESLGVSVKMQVSGPCHGPIESVSGRWHQSLHFVSIWAGSDVLEVAGGAAEQDARSPLAPALCPPRPRPLCPP